MSETRNDITLDASMTAFRREVQGRLNRLEASHRALQNKGGLYAWEHRRMIDLYRDVLSTIDARWERAKADRESSLPSVDEHGIEIHF